jgi:very-short-patch-repair endonuclease
MATPITPLALRNAITEALWANVKSYDLAEVCEYLGLEPQGEYEDPHDSKRGYVNSRLLGKDLTQLTDIARKVDEQFGDEALAHLLQQLGAKGVSGELKNLIFSADGPKPLIVLRDAVNNVIEIVENAQYCLVYDRPLAEQGLTWRELVDWWITTQRLPPGDQRQHALALYERLKRSLAGNGAEELMFHTYCELYGRPGGFDLPALVPQVYLHYDPYTRRQRRDREGPLRRQRMDFLMLMPHRARVIIEVDGRLHYATSTGQADPPRYAAMMAEDRALILSGYEVYRFGTADLAQPDAKTMLTAFFEELLQRHGCQPTETVVR